MGSRRSHLKVKTDEDSEVKELVSRSASVYGTKRNGKDWLIVFVPNNQIGRVVASLKDYGYHVVVEDEE